MNKKVDYSNLGGFPLDQDVLDFMQASYRDCFGALANLCGNKVIVTGVVEAGGNVSSGWIVYNGEFIPFIGGPAGAKVTITTAVTAAVFEDDANHDIELTKTATCAALGDFDFADLVRLSSLQNIWLPGDLKQKFVDNAYIAAHFDVDGIGSGVETGWRILSELYPPSSGKILINRNPADADFDTCGKYGGSKTTTLTKAQLPKENILGIVDQTTIAAGGFGMMKKSTVGDSSTVGTVDAGGSGSEPNLLTMSPFPNLGNGDAVDKMNPYFVVLTLIKM